MRVARQALTRAAAGLVEELKAEDELDERVGVVQEPKIGRLIVEIDGEGAVVTYRFGGVPHVSSPGQRPFTQMRHREGNILKEQVYCERLGSSPLNSGECAASNTSACSAGTTGQAAGAMSCCLSLCTRGNFRRDPPGQSGGCWKWEGVSQVLIPCLDRFSQG